MEIVYQLTRDEERIRRVQRATLTTAEFGFQQTDGLYGSEEWWENIRTGALPLHRLTGVITKVYMGSMRDWPEFRMRTALGEESSWTRYVHTKEQDGLYVVGRRIEIDYVVQRYKPKSWNGDREQPCVIAVRIEVPQLQAGELT